MKVVLNLLPTVITSSSLTSLSIIITITCILLPLLMYVLFISPAEIVDHLEAACCDRKTKKQVKQRSYVLQELLQTELNYVNGLEFVKTHFVNPLLKDGDTNTVETVFNSWLPITKLHQDFLLRLKAALLDTNNKPKASTITSSRLAAKEFSKLAPFLKLYIPFVQKYNVALSRISNDLRNNGKISQQVDLTATKNDLTKGKLHGGLGPLLALPFQRLCKYGLLLRELNRTFSSSGRTGKLVYNAMKMVDTIVLKVNDAKAMSDNGERMFEIQTALKDDKMIDIPVLLRKPMNVPLLQPARKLLYEGPLLGSMYQESLPMNRTKDLFHTRDKCPGNHFILFSDVLLIVNRTEPTKWTNEKMILCHCIELHSLRLVELNNDNNNRNSNSSGGGSRSKSSKSHGKSNTGKLLESTVVVSTVLHWSRPRPFSRLAFGIEWDKTDDNSCAGSNSSGVLRENHSNDSGVAFVEVLRIKLNSLK